MTPAVAPRFRAARAVAALAAVAASLAVVTAVVEQQHRVQKRMSRDRAGLIARQLSHKISGPTLLHHFTSPSPGGEATGSTYIQEDPSMPTQMSADRLHFFRGFEGEIPPRKHPPFAASRRKHRYEMGARPVGHSGHGEEEVNQWKLIHYCKKHYGVWKNCPLASYIKEPRH